MKKRQYTGYSFVDCQSCATTTRRRQALGSQYPCPKCGSENVTLRAIWGREVKTIECGGKCQSATGPNCDCNCAGENHGKAAA